MEPEINRFDGEYEFLSNFYAAPIIFRGHTCDTLEHAFQGARGGNRKEFMEIINCKTPGQAKRLARSLKRPKNWDAYKVRLMLRLLRRKFAPDTMLAHKLLKTKDATLIEGNTWGDVYWGMVNGVGENMLGKLLMQVRYELQQHTIIANKGPYPVNG